ncbi:MAG: hypothetical protein H8D49_01165 [Dehalococcoidia bacterium]|nr:hypothetical protein [Dehalococcoidia bacterium]
MARLTRNKVLASRLPVPFVSLAIIPGIVLPFCAGSVPEVADFEVLPVGTPAGNSARLAANVFLPGQDMDGPAIFNQRPSNRHRSICRQ